MGRVNMLLLALLMLCAIGVITSQHRARRIFGELEAEQATAKKLDEEFTQLRLEQSTWATNKRVEALASKSLGMRLPESGTTVVVTLDSRSQPGASR